MSKEWKALLTLIAVGIICGLIGLGVIVKAVNRTPKPVRWEYKVLAIQDDSREARKSLEQSGTNSIEAWRLGETVFNGQFDMLAYARNELKPGPDWELCGTFLEPLAKHPHLMLIFKRPL
jgi:hypothetical protein